MQEVQLAKLEKVLIAGDLACLNSGEKLDYNKAVCDSLGLNWLTRPLEFIKLNGKEVLYAKKDATDQLRKLYEISITITSRERFGDIYVVTAQARTPNGRCDESTGAVDLKGKQGDALANLFMKCETKAKRRVTLSICGLGLLDETEVETIPGAARVVEPPPPQIAKKEDPHSLLLKRIFEIKTGKNFETSFVQHLAQELYGVSRSTDLNDQQLEELAQLMEKHDKETLTQLAKEAKEFRSLPEPKFDEDLDVALGLK
jgi:hypothetical protein